ncbi:MAG: hypothetical protein JWQ09_3130 [Segetibacter sp.]|nr:hypothetical protein [Segetibacter sp.]
MPDICIYCKTNASAKSEHAFPKGLGGEDVYVDFVCNECNNKFSKYELHLMQLSIVALMKSYEGVEGYEKKKGVEKNRLKFKEILQYVPEDETAYEVGLYEGFKPFVIPQIIEIQAEFYIESFSEESATKLIQIFQKWIKDNQTIIKEFSKDKSIPSIGRKIFRKDDKLIFSTVEVSKGKSEILYNEIEKDDTNKHYYDKFFPRVFLDDRNRLTIRARSFDEAETFLLQLVSRFINAPFTITSFSPKLSQDWISVQIKFNIKYMQRALVKIGLNCLLHYFPDAQTYPEIEPAIDHVMKGTPLPSSFQEKVVQIDSDRQVHTILFIQDPRGLILRIALFKAQFIYSILIENMQLFSNDEDFRVLEIDYVSHKQKLLDKREFAIQKALDLGVIKKV